MAREFIMGARLLLTDAFSGPLRYIRDGLSRTQRDTNLYRDANGRLRDELGRFARQARQTESDMRGIGAAAEGAKGHLLSLKSAIVAVASGAAIKKGFDWLVQGNADMETYQNTLAVVLKSQQKAADTLAWASAFAANTPFEIPEVVEATTKLASYGMEAQKVLGVTGDMASVMGKSLDQAVEAIADAQTGELERLKEFGITKAMIEAQGAKMGATLTNKSGQITDQKAFNAALFSLMEERYSGGMELQSKTFKGMLSNASDFIGTMGRELGKPLFDKLKVGLGEVLEWAQRIKDSGQLAAWMATIQRWAGLVWQAFVFAGGIVVRVFKGISTGIQVAIGWVRQIFTEISAQAGGKAVTTVTTIGQRLVAMWHDFYAAAQPVISNVIGWLVDTGFPALQAALVAVGVWVVNVAAWFTENWSTIKPFIIGLAIAWGTYYTYLKLVQGGMLLIRGATIAWTAAQAALNVVMNMNPIGLIITGIGLLIGAIILLVQNWDTVTAFFKKWGAVILGAVMGPLGWLIGFLVKYWDKIKGAAIAAWDAIVGALAAAWNWVRGIVSGVFNWLIANWRKIVTGILILMGPIGWAVLGLIRLIRTNWTAIVTFLATVWGAIRDGAVAAWNWVSNAASAAWNWIVGAAQGAVNWLAGIWQGFVAVLAGIWTAITTAASAAWNFVQTTVIEPVVTWIGNRFEELKTGVMLVWDGISNAISGVASAVQNVWTGVLDWFSSKFEWLTGKFKWISDTAGKIVGGAKDFISGTADAVFGTNGSHATGLSKVPFDGYTATLHKGEAVLTAAEARRYDTAMGFQQQAAPVLPSKAAQAPVQDVSLRPTFQVPAQPAPNVVAAATAPAYSPIIQAPAATAPVFNPVVQAAASPAPVFSPVIQAEERQRQIVFQAPAQEEARRFDQALQDKEPAQPNARRFDNALGSGTQRPATAAAAPVYHIEKLVEKVEIQAAPGDDGEALYEKFINVFHRKAKEAASILSNAEMGALL